MQTNNPEKHGESPVVRHTQPLPIFIVVFFNLLYTSLGLFFKICKKKNKETVAF